MQLFTVNNHYFSLIKIVTVKKYYLPLTEKSTV